MLRVPGRTLTTACALTVSLLSGCVMPGPTLEEQVQAQQRMAAMMAQSAEMAAPFANAKPSEKEDQPQLPNTTEADLRATIDALPVLDHGVAFEPKRDGFDVEGVRYIDPEGEIISYGTNYATGDATYLAKTGESDYLVKYIRVLTGHDAITIAAAKRDASGWQIKLATGKTIRGDRIIPMSQGIVITRATTAFRYIPGEGTKNFSAADGWHIASFQNGDVASTGYILLERDPVKQNQIESLISRAQAMGNTLGLTQKHDYMLVHVESGKTVPLDIPIDGKQLAFLTNCYQRGTFISFCRDGFTMESLWDQNGVKNFRHYFWRIQWLNSPRGPIAIAQEHGLKDITLTDLETGTKATAFSRPLGIASFDVKQASNGTISIVAQLGFTAEALPDAVAFLDQNGSVPVASHGEESN